MQAAVLPLFDKAYVIQDRISLQLHFKAKRDHVLARLKAMGLEVKIPPTSTFYIWLSLESLPAPLNIGLVFFEECLKVGGFCSICDLSFHHDNSRFFFFSIALGEGHCCGGAWIRYLTDSSGQHVQLAVPSLRPTVVRSADG